MMGTKRLEQTIAIDVNVLGGTFKVGALRIDPDQTEESVTHLIQSTPMNMWFVIVGDDSNEEEDLLSIVDEDLSFRSVGYGVFIPTSEN